VRRTLGLLAVVTLIAGVPATAQARQSVRLDVALTPERLGQGTTIGFGFRIATPARRVPPPLTRVEISYPVEFGFALSELGLSTCSAWTLEVAGPEGCPANSLMGHGTALAEIPVGPSILEETASVTIVRSAEHNGHLGLLVYAEGETPVSAQIVFPGLILPAAPPFGGHVDMSVPLVPSLPNGPDVAIVRFRSTLGPRHLRYNEHVHGRLVEYEPRGIPLPARCPPGGFVFAAKFGFVDGSHASASTAVPCPPGSHRRGGG
jgi:hypothetical protein